MIPAHPSPGGSPPGPCPPGGSRGTPGSARCNRKCGRHAPPRLNALRAPRGALRGAAGPRCRAPRARGGGRAPPPRARDRARPAPYLPCDAGDESHLLVAHLPAAVLVSRGRSSGARFRRWSRHPAGGEGGGPGEEIARGGGATAAARGQGQGAGGGHREEDGCRPERGSHMGCRHPAATSAAEASPRPPLPAQPSRPEAAAGATPAPPPPPPARPPPARALTGGSAGARPVFSHPSPRLAPPDSALQPIGSIGASLKGYETTALRG